MILGDLERLVDAFLDGDGGHDDDELGESVPFVQLEDRSQVDIRLARARFHLHREITGGQRVGRRHTVTELEVLQVFEDILVEQGQAIADTKIVLGKDELGLGS